MTPISREKAAGVPLVLEQVILLAGDLQTFKPHANLRAYQQAEGRPWQHDLPGIDGGTWTLAINTSAEPAHAGPASGMDCDVPGRSVGVWWNGWLAGFVDAGGGALARGEAANEDSLLAAIKKARDEAHAGRLL